MIDEEIKAELHEVVKEFFARHKVEFKTYGDALNWLHNAEYEVYEAEAGKLGYSKFATDILWLVVTNGPNTIVDFNLLKPIQHRKPVSAITDPKANTK